MAGHSRRFKEKGYELPKFLLKLGSQTVIEKVINMFSYEDNFHLILNKKLDNLDEVIDYLQQLSPNIHIYLINSHEKGPAYSVLSTDLNILDSEPILISYCDFTIDWDYKRFKREAEGCDAGVPFFRGFHASSLGDTKYAYMKIESNRMLELKEKESFTSYPMSEPASCGIYYFKSLSYFHELASELFQSKIALPNGEAYVSLLLNLSVRRGDFVFSFKVNKFICLGTPEDYEQYLFWEKIFVSTPNQIHREKIIDYSLIPMAGEGSRFKESGFRASKPFIQIGEELLFEKCVRSLPASKNYIYILREHNSISKLIQARISLLNNESHIDVIHIKNKTEGQVNTCLMAENYYSEKGSLLISSCDYELRFNQSLLTNELNSDSDVLIFTCKLGSLPVASYDSFAYCQVDKHKNVLSIVEKECISNTPQNDHMVTGTFWFRKASYFTNAAKDLLSRKHKINNEYYVGTSINSLISEGLKVRIFEVDQWASFGNPTELDLYLYWQDYFNQ